MKKNAKISVIVPLYNTEKYISQCLDSIVAQTYEDLEIIVVDDGSSDGSSEIAREYAERDERIKVIRKDNNEGLYHARMSGVEAASGEYIGFVDSDDTVSVDYFRSLLCAAEEAGADITLAKSVEEDEQGRRYIHNVYHYYSPGKITGEEARRAFWEQEGACFIFHTVWNKLYARSLWERAMPRLKRQTEHLVMCEDLVFSSVLFHFAECMTSTEYACYRYRKHSAASTANGGSMRKYEKNIRDLTVAFRFVEGLVEDCSDTKLRGHFDRWRALYKHFWRENVKESRFGVREKRKLYGMLDEFDKKRDTGIHSPSYFYSVTTDYDNRYDEIVEAIADVGCETVSFDIFDTAIMRPFYRADDLFVMLDETYRRMCPTDTRRFSEIRISAEIETRERLCRENIEDVTLEEIYGTVAEECSAEIAKKMKNAEITAELRYAMPRRSVQNLWRLAKHLGRKVYFTSDMYLGRNILEEMLKKCGYIPENILVSCDTGATKRSGNLFRVLLEECGSEAEHVTHVGDNYECDVEAARRQKIRTYMMPRAIDCLEYNIPTIKSTHTANCYTEPSGSVINYQQGLSFFGTRSALALAACRLYDNPYISYNEHSEMNASPTYFGYYALGMHLLGFVKWLTEISVEVGYDRLLFVSRDGYLPMLAYRILKKHYPDSPAYSYVRTSRKATLPAELTRAEEIIPYAKRMNVQLTTPAMLERIFAPVLSSGSTVQAVSSIAFGSVKAFESYAKRFLIPRFDSAKAEEARQLLREYLDKEITPRSAVVDVGYSARLQEIIFRETGKSTDALYVHVNSGEVARREQSCGFDVHSFYEFTPSISGAVRELLFSEPTGSVTGYERTHNGIEAISEKTVLSAGERYLISEIQRSALDFISDFSDTFGDVMDKMYTRGVDISLPFEYFVHTLGEVDAAMFSCIVFEDELWSGGSFTLADRWLEAISYHGIAPHYKTRAYNTHTGGDVSQKRLYDAYYSAGIDKKSRISKALFWLAADKGVFVDKLKRRIYGETHKNE